MEVSHVLHRRISRAHLFHFAVRSNQIRLLLCVIPLDVLQRILEPIVRLGLSSLQRVHLLRHRPDFLFPIEQRLPQLLDVVLAAFQDLFISSATLMQAR